MILSKINLLERNGVIQVISLPVFSYSINFTQAALSGPTAECRQEEACGLQHKWDGFPALLKECGWLVTCFPKERMIHPER